MVGAPLTAQLVKNLPAMQADWTTDQFLGWEDPLEKGIGYLLQYSCASLVAQLVKNPPAMLETWVWIFIGRTDIEAETPILWPPDAKNWLMEKTLMLGKIEGRRRRERQRWDGWMASPTQWTWVWVNSRSWWWIGRPGMLQSMGLQRVRHSWATELNWTELRHGMLYYGKFAMQSLSIEEKESTITEFTLLAKHCAINLTHVWGRYNHHYFPSNITKKD